MTISATDILVPVCSKIPLLYLLTQKVAQKFGYVLGIFYVEKGKGAVLTFLLWDTESMFLVQPMENNAGEQKEYQAGFADFE